MLAGVSGDLLSRAFSTQILPASFAGRLGEAGRSNARRSLRSWWRRHGQRLGPASSIRDVFDLGAVPVFEVLGHRPLLDAVLAEPPRATATLPVGRAGARVIVLPWGVPMNGCGTDLARHAGAAGARWGLTFNGTAVRLIDLGRTHARRHLEFGLEAVLEHPPSFNLFWACLREPAFDTLLELMAAASAEYGVGVCTALRTGVIDGVELLMRAMVGRFRTGGASSRADARLAGAYEQAITIVYRILFLCFAESRGLLPAWHPVYRGAYSALALREAAERPGLRRGVWEMLRAISLMAHSGCQADDLQVTAFNGRLFAPSRTPLAQRAMVDDELVGRAVLAITTRSGPSGRERIAFRDLGVEQLGAVYESVLDYEPAAAPALQPPAGRACPREAAVRLVGTGTRRKSSGTFYTPVAITDHLVRATLGPLADAASADGILGLKVLDPAMGSGAFLVAACRYLADAYERAIVRDTGRMAADITEDERASFRRLVAQRCLYGVDVNPMAVQVARLSMWLTTLAADQPLTFLDHHFATGDSLVGASLDDIARQSPGPSRASWPGIDTLPFEPGEIGLVLRQALPIRQHLAAQPDSEADIVRQKEAALRQLNGRHGTLGPLLRLADAWCGWWFWQDAHAERPHAREYGDLLRALRGQTPSLRDRFLSPRLAAIDRVARSRRFFHWTLMFPEVFYDASGDPRPDGGFDAIVGNPPWEMVRGDTGAADERQKSRQFGRQLTTFARESGIYRACGGGHLNLYQLFVERALRLARPGGSVGLVVPWGLFADHGSSNLRRHLFEHCDTRQLTAFENTAGIFPVHRGVRFVLVTASPGTATRSIRCRFGLRTIGDLERTDAGDPSNADGPAKAGENAPDVITPRMLATLSGPRLAVPWIRSRQDLRLLESLTSRFPLLSERAGWNARFGRELNATDDAHLFEPRSIGDRPLRKTHVERPVVEGRQIEPFRVDLSASRLCLRADARVRPELAAAMRRWRLGYRDVASATNRLTVIAALVPPAAVTVHTVFCLKTTLPLRGQSALCALMNSFVLNFLARLWVTTHVTTDVIEHLPAPCASHCPRGIEAIGRMAVRLSRRPDDTPTSVRLQARVGHLYGLSRDELEHVLGTFPLVDPGYRSAILSAFQTDASEV